MNVFSKASKSRRSTTALVLFGTIAMVSIPGCGRPRKPNVLLITLDTVRSDHCSAYGYWRPTTPTLENLARQGSRFAAAYAPMATTVPSHATMFTGLSPLGHGVLKNGYVLGAERRTLSEALKEDGYATAAVVSALVLRRKYGLAQGFDQYLDRFDPADSSRMQRIKEEGVEVDRAFDQRASAATSRASAILADLASREAPFFLWVHYFDPHIPYAAPPEFDGLFNESPPRPGNYETWIRDYDREIRYVDQEIGKLLNALDTTRRSSDTMVIVVADHGEGLMQHGHMEHGLQIYEEGVRVPLLFRWPGTIEAGSAIDQPVQLVDLSATILDLTGSKQDFSGMSFAEGLRGGKMPVKADIFFQRRLYDEGTEISGKRVVGFEFGVRRDHWKYIEARDENRYELYDLATDPGETRNLINDRPTVRATLSRDLERWVRQEFARGVSRQQISDEDRKSLEALGYVH